LWLYKYVNSFVRLKRLIYRSYYKNLSNFVDFYWKKHHLRSNLNEMHHSLLPLINILVWNQYLDRIIDGKVNEKSKFKERNSRRFFWLFYTPKIKLIDIFSVPYYNTIYMQMDLEILNLMKRIAWMTANLAVTSNDPPRTIKANWSSCWTIFDLDFNFWSLK